MRVTVLLFALARETVGASELMVELAPNSTVRDLKAEIARACPALVRLLPTLRIAIDSEYVVDDDQTIPGGAEIAAIPPVSGGSWIETASQP